MEQPKQPHFGLQAPLYYASAVETLQEKAHKDGMAEGKKENSEQIKKLQEQLATVNAMLQLLHTAYDQQTELYQMSTKELDLCKTKCSTLQEGIAKAGSELEEILAWHKHLIKEAPGIESKMVRLNDITQKLKKMSE